MPKFTTEDLLLYLYNEMNAEQKSEIEAALLSDWALEQKYQVLKESRKSLNRINPISPRSQTIAAIMQYAQESVHFSN